MSTVTVNPPKTPVTKGSSGIATATIPNICKMPGPPAPFVPTPLPNIGQSGKDPQGYSTTVKIEDNAVAIRGASFGSSGDVASQGTGGGIVSNNVEGPTKFIGPGSFNVQIEGKNVQLLADQMLNNCGPSGSPANSATMAGVLQTILAAATTEKPTTTCTSANGHSWAEQTPAGVKLLDDKIRDAKAEPPGSGTHFEGLAAEHNKSAGDLKRSDQMSDPDDSHEKIWWQCTVCGFRREGDQTHDDPNGGKSVAVEVKSKPKFDERDARQLGRNCQAVRGGGASGLIYKLPQGGKFAWLTKHIKDVGNALGVAIKVIRV
jgi:hypothetical protein